MLADQGLEPTADAETVRQALNMRIYQLLYSLGVLAVLAGCDQQAMFEKFIPKEEADNGKAASLPARCQGL
jgi:hypothetical protein